MTNENNQVGKCHSPLRWRGSVCLINYSWNKCKYCVEKKSAITSWWQFTTHQRLFFGEAQKLGTCIIQLGSSRQNLRGKKFYFRRQFLEQQWKRNSRTKTLLLAWVCFFGNPVSYFRVQVWNSCFFLNFWQQPCIKNAWYPLGTGMPEYNVQLRFRACWLTEAVQPVPFVCTFGQGLKVKTSPRSHLLVSCDAGCCQKLRKKQLFRDSLVQALTWMKCRLVPNSCSSFTVSPKIDAENRISYLSGFACYCPTVLCIYPAFALLQRTVFGASVNCHHDVIALFFSTQYLHLFHE